MKKTLLSVLALSVVGAIASLAVFLSSPIVIEKAKSEASKDNKVITIANNSSDFEENKVLQARFLNMLNHNFVYNDSFHSVDEIVNNSIIALLDKRDSQDDSFIDENIVAEYVYNMYGIEIDDFSDINIDMPKKEGYVYIIPRGYEIYSHKISSINLNEDGSYTVNTLVTVSSMGGQDLTFNCESLFVKNSASAFGFSIIYSNIDDSQVAI